ncbi:hypothetical protein [Bradyrhizobium sp. 170]|uniref:hypothetical protein n=1 Tax=Bradyrhizobium sp. 170 TaxID=2782641 RepID=UPI001FFFDC82|nr:hypothetical protein [Bradyrhizobium sp. 170]UPK03147.1 hypothetical protein IVB05_37325 [Bradyrhizobium sp. 170]
MRLVLTPTGWAPFDADAREFHQNQSSGEPIAAQVIEIEPLHDRDMIEHRRIMATINELAKALHSTPEKVRAELLVATGNFVMLGDLLGTPVVAINSMSRRNMKDHELHAFWGEAKEVIQSKLLPRITDTAERDRLAETLLLQPA